MIERDTDHVFGKIKLVQTVAEQRLLFKPAHGNRHLAVHFREADYCIRIKGESKGQTLSGFPVRRGVDRGLSPVSALVMQEVM